MLNFVSIAVHTYSVNIVRINPLLEYFAHLCDNEEQGSESYERNLSNSQIFINSNKYGSCLWQSVVVSFLVNIFQNCST